MDPFSISRFFIFAFFLILTAFFSCAETACTAVSSLKLRSLVERKVKHAALLQDILENPRKLLTTLLLGSSFCNVAASALATSFFLSLFQLMGPFNFIVEMAIVTIAVTACILIIGEIIPKMIALKNPHKTALIMATAIHNTILVLSPFIVLLNFFTHGLSKRLGVSFDSEHLVTTEDIKTLVTVGEEEGLIDDVEKQMIHSIFDFSETIVRQIMTPRPDAVCMDVKSTVSEVIYLIQEHGHSRIPLYEDKIDNIVGIVFAKDLLSVGSGSLSVRKFMREIFFIPETQNIVDLLHQMKRSKFHLAAVVDEYGGFSGLVTMEDIIEEIMGEIQDEYDEDEKPLFTELSPGRFLVDAGMNIDDLGDKLKIKFPMEEDFDTIGGFVLSLSGKFPLKGEILEYDCIKIKVNEVSKKRILSLEIELK